MNKMIAKFGVLAVLAIALAFLAFPTAAFATGTVEVSTEQTFIPEGCENCQASPLVFKFEADTILKVGDQMEFAMTNHAVLAKKIDMIVGDDGNPPSLGGAPTIGTVYESLTFCDSATGAGALVLPPQSSNTSPLVYSGNVSFLTDAGGVCFRLQGSVGSDKIMMTILGTPAEGTGGSLVSLWGTGPNASMGTLEVVVDPTEDGILILRVFDLETYADDADPLTEESGASIYLPVVGATINMGYTDEIDDPNDNALCIDVSAEESPGVFYAALGENVDMNVDTQGQYTFNNSPFAIAYITGEERIARYICSKVETGYVPLGFSASQDSSGEDCAPFYNDRGIYTNYALTSDGFCTDTHRCNKAILYTEGEETLSATRQYKAKFEILVNGMPGDNGVYWSNSSTDVPAFMTESDNVIMDLVIDPSADQVSGDFTAYLAGGVTEVVDGNIVAAAAFTGCDVPAESRAVILESDYALFDLTNAGVDNKLWMAIPPMIYRTGEGVDAFQPGDIVSVRISIFEAPCGLWWSGEMQITTATASCAGATPSTGATLLYPYFPASNTTGIFNVMTLCNNSAAAGTATVMLYEADGDAFTATVDVDARGVAQVILGAFGSLPGYSQTTGAGTLGDSAFYVVATTTFSTGGVAAVVNTVTGSSAAYDIIAK